MKHRVTVEQNFYGWVTLAFQRVVKYFCVLGSALVIYNYIENNCAFTILVNGSITKILNWQNDSVLQYWKYQPLALQLTLVRPTGIEVRLSRVQCVTSPGKVIDLKDVGIGGLQ